MKVLSFQLCENFKNNCDLKREEQSRRSTANAHSVYKIFFLAFWTKYTTIIRKCEIIYFILEYFYSNTPEVSIFKSSFLGEEEKKELMSSCCLSAIILLVFQNKATKWGHILLLPVLASRQCQISTNHADLFQAIGGNIMEPPDELHPHTDH